MKHASRLTGLPDFKHAIRCSTNISRSSSQRGRAPKLASCDEKTGEECDRYESQSWSVGSSVLVEHKSEGEHRLLRSPYAGYGGWGSRSSRARSRMRQRWGGAVAAPKCVNIGAPRLCSDLFSKIREALTGSPRSQMVLISVRAFCPRYTSPPMQKNILTSERRCNR